MHAKKTSKFITAFLATVGLLLGSVVGITAPAQAVEDCTGMPTVKLVSDPVMYSATSANYDANYIGYEITGGSSPSTALTVTLNTFQGPRVTLAATQNATQSIGALATGATAYVYFLAKLGTAATTSESHKIVLTDGSQTCTRQTVINPATAKNPAATSNASNKVESINVGTAPSTVGGTITVTVKGDTGQVGNNEGVAFAPVSSSSFAANKWTLVSSEIRINQDNSWVDKAASATKVFTNRLYLPYLEDATYGVGKTLGDFDGKYTATYVFKLIEATNGATQMKPIQYVGNVYTGTVPGGTVPTITATAAVSATLTLSATSNYGTIGQAITSITVTRNDFTASCVAPTPGYTISPAVGNGLTFDSANGTISGTPTSVLSSTTYTVTAIQGASPCQSSDTPSASFTIEIAAARVPSITPGTTPISGNVGNAVSAAAFTSNDFSCTPVYSATLPAGLSIDSGTGVISGIPTAVSSATVVVTGACGSESATSNVTFSINAASGGGAPAPEPDRKVTICHRTHATTNPYVRITVDYNSVNKKSGHQGHDEIFAGEHVFKAGIYKRAKDKDWGDIIPADPSGLNRWQPLNWTALGAAIYNGTVAGCPSYDPVKYYNALREAGVPEKQIKKEMADLETEQSEANPSREKKDPSTLKYTGTNTKALEEENDKVTICHRTNSVTNPYVKITVAASSIYKNAGHYGHDEIYDGHHVFDSTVNYPNNKKDWGDIIPADPTGKNRWAPLNMTTLGKAIYNGTVAGCAEKSTQELYNELREEGKSKKEIMDDLEKQKNIDEDPKDLEELTYTGKDPEVEKTEPKEPVAPSNVKIPDQSLSGIVWLDLNRDGLKDPNEPLMPNITLGVVQLTNVAAPVTPARAGLRAAAGVKAAAVTVVKTDANGFYLFPSLGAGDWQVVTTIPENLEVTYDSQAVGDGEIVATVPVASHAFTWVGLVGDDPKVNKAIVDALEKAGPGATVKVDSKGNIIVVKPKPTTPAAAGTELAATGSNQLAWLAFGMLMALGGALLLVTRKAYQK